MQDSANQDSAGVFAIEDNVPAAFYATNAGTNLLTSPAQRGILGKHLAARFEIADVK
jgi:hypothetical protein